MKTVKMPRVDPAMEKGVVVKWLKKEGDEVKEGEHVLTIMTEKVEFEVKSPANGTLHKIIAKEGVEVPVGEPLALILELGEAPPIEAEKVELKASPAARRLAEEYGVDLTKVRGTGPEGRIVRDDVLRAIEAQKEGIKSIKLHPLRLITAQKMVQSHQSIPPVTITMNMDGEELIRAKRELGVAYDAVFVKAVGRALREYEAFNSSFSDDGLKVHRAVNVGVAVATEQGLIVPVVHDADTKSLQAISKEIEELAEKARSGKLSMKDVSGGTFTITNLGMFGVESFTPIVVPGQSAILGIGIIEKKPVVVEDRIVVKPQLHLSLTFDHRVADGALAAKFLKRVKELVEKGEFRE